MKHHIRERLLYTFQMIAAVLVALEVSIPPNPYKHQLIIGLVVLICLKHNIPEKILQILEKYTK